MRAGPPPGIRWLLVLAGICLGLACGTKWNGAWYIPAFAVLVIAWDLGARRAAGYRSAAAGMLRSDAPWAAVWFVLAPVAVYVACWSGWFATGYGYNRSGVQLSGHRISTLAAWLAYNKWMLQFGTGLTQHSNYESNPLGWLVLARPTSFYSVCLPAAASGCGDRTEQEVLAIGTPLIWWGGTLALAVCLVWWLARRDWRAGSVLTGVAAGWLPWIWFYLHDHRTEFYFYAVIFDPFLVIAITLCLGLVIGPARAKPARRVTGAVVSGLYLLAVLADFAYIYPVLAAKVIPFTSWDARMWFSSWI